MEGFLHLDKRDAAVCRRAHLCGKERVKLKLCVSVVPAGVPAGNKLISGLQALADVPGRPAFPESLIEKVRYHLLWLYMLESVPFGSIC